MVNRCNGSSMSPLKKIWYCLQRSQDEGLHILNQQFNSIFTKEDTFHVKKEPYPGLNKFEVHVNGVKKTSTKPQPRLNHRGLKFDPNITSNS